MSDLCPPDDHADACTDDDIPEAWIAVLRGEISRDEVFPPNASSPDMRLARELFTPLAATTVTHIVARAVDDRLGPAVVLIRPPARQRGLVRFGGAAALLAAALALMMLRSEPGMPSPIEAEVTAAPAMRDVGPARPTKDVRVLAGTGFYLKCAPLRDDLTYTLEVVRAIQTGGETSEQYRLGFRTTTAKGSSQEVHVMADLPRGTYEVTCGVVLADSRFAWFGPPAVIVVK